MYHEPLTIPTDVEILKLLLKGDRQTPANVGAHLDRDPRYMSERLRNLEQREYIRDAPPAERSGMYELTALGAIAAYHITGYVRDYHNIFHALITRILDGRPDDGFYPDLITIDDASRTALYELTQVEGLIVPSDLHIELVQDAGYAPDTAREALYSLSCQKLAERVDDMDVYRTTNRGEKVVELLLEDVTGPKELTDQLRETYTDEEMERLNMVCSVNPSS